MAKIIQIDLNRIDPARIDTRLRRNGEEARLVSFVQNDDDVIDEFGNTGEVYIKLTKEEYAKGHRGRLVGYSQPLNFKMKRKHDTGND